MYICSIELSPLVGKDQGSPSISRAYFLYDYGTLIPQHYYKYNFLST